ncbi:MAG: efflux RND transporter permease subunit [Magnetococcales bacterium]|nr:efflux RND transporter permease subunit [Magnetococcales bacterium]
MTTSSELQPPPPPSLEHPDAKNLGVAGIMAKAFIHSPLSPLFLFACLAMGIMGLLMTPRQEDPQISVPMVDIFVQYGGASSDQVSSLVTAPLERIMSEISGVKHVYSASMRGQGMITVEFDVGEDMEASLVKLYDKLQSNMDRMPPGVEPPLVKPKSVDDVPIITLTLWSNEVNDSVLRVLSLDVLQKLNEVKDSSQGFIVGGRAQQIRVEVFPERLSGFGISLDQIAQTIKTANSEKDIGSVESGDTGYRVITGNYIRNAEDLSQLMVGTRFGSPIYVRDVAQVFSGAEETRQMVTYTTGPAYEGKTPPASAASAVTIAVAKKTGSNGVTVANNILSRVEELKGSLIPDNVQVSITRNYGETANEKVNELLFKLVVATSAVTLLVWYALGFKPAVVTLVVIPVVILMTVFSAWILGFTIDRVSLFALIFSIGILVDDAIVVVENIYRRWLLEDNCCHLISIDAVREVGNPTILATFTVIAALMPMAAVRGMMGPYMEPIAVLGSVAMLFSLFAAFIFTPWLAQLIKPSMKTLHHHSEKERKSADRLEKMYRSVIPALLDSRAKGFGFLIALFVGFGLSCLLFYTTDVTVKIMPLDNKPEFNVVINLDEGTALPKTANVAHDMTELIRQKVPEVIALQTYVGTASPFNFNGMVRHYYLRHNSWEADIQVQLLHKSKRERTSHEIAEYVRSILTPVAQSFGAKIQVVEMPPGPPVLQSVVAEVTGPTAEIRREVAAHMTKLFEEAEGIVDVDNYMQKDFELWRFEVDSEKAVRQGISVDTINRNLGMAMGGARLGDVKRGNVLEPTYIVIQVPMAIRSKITSLSDLPISTPMGATIPLGELGHFVKGLQDSIHFRKDLRPVEYVTGEVTGLLDAPIYSMMDIDEKLKSYTTPDGQVIAGEFLGAPETYAKTGFEWTGEWTVTFETFRDMGMAFGVALILIYMLVVWEFGNFVLPAIIMAPIPLTLLGIVPGHMMMDAKFTATSMIGFIALAGIIVRNSILLVDFAQQEILKGESVRDSVILSCKARTRPIVITALALVAGSSVILSDFIFRGMAVSLLFGSLISTVLTLLVIPLGCVTFSSAFKHPAQANKGQDPDSDCDVRESVEAPALSAFVSTSAVLPQTQAAPEPTAQPSIKKAPQGATSQQAVVEKKVEKEPAIETEVKRTARKPSARKPAVKKTPAKRQAASEEGKATTKPAATTKGGSARRGIRMKPKPAAKDPS